MSMKRSGIRITAYARKISKICLLFATKVILRRDNILKYSNKTIVNNKWEKKNYIHIPFIILLVFFLDFLADKNFATVDKLWTIIKIEVKILKYKSALNPYK